MIDSEVWNIKQQKTESLDYVKSKKWKVERKHAKQNEG